jgi:alpha-galactosidase
MKLGACTIETGGEGVLFSLGSGVQKVSLGVPAFEIDGAAVSDWRLNEVEEPGTYENFSVFEATLTFESVSTGSRLELLLNGSAASSIVRFRLSLVTAGKLTRRDVTGPTYFTLPATADLYEEVQLSHWDHVVHSYLPGRTPLDPEELYEGRTLPGPILLMHTADSAALVAYEHGSDYPQTFLQFERLGDHVSLVGTKGNYHDGQEASGFQSVWFQVAVAPDGDRLLRDYRQFLLEEICPTPESRKPYVFYNTWNHQERLKYFKKRPYLDEMNLERMLAEIDVAHRLGIDVFVIDTGWYSKTGDWEVNLERFPDGLQEIRRKIDGYGMKLGLWFNPIVAAQTSKVYLEHPEWVMSSGGKPNFWGSIWETEDSYGMCLCSGYVDSFIETLVRLNRELGVSYFKWDAIGQYGCDSTDHDHGTSANSREERADCYAYESGRRMIRIVEEVTQRCPGVIVDFDVTEGGRFMGLGFLSAGKYFLVNNGPYFHDFDIPKEHHREPETINVFFNPGPARARICRTGSRYDSIVPSILFLTHYLPDAPALSQQNSLAALALGGNGIWGDLVSLSEDDIALLSEGIGRYKRVAGSVTQSYPRTVGYTGSSPEVHEKLVPERAEGLVAFFTDTPGTFQHVTQPLAKVPDAVHGADHWTVSEGNRLLIEVKLGRNDARLVTVEGGG